MTQKEKAAAYDLALKVLHKYDGANIMFSDDLKEEMFPELKESEDKKVKESLMQYIWDLYHKDFCPPKPSIKTCDKWISWLEKQVENQPAEQSPFTFNDVFALQCAMASAKESDEKLYEALRSLHDRVHDIYHGERKENVKPAGKPEPRFHNGEWIANGDYTWKIVEVKPLDYTLQSQEGNIVDDTISHVDEQFHSFTIQDAKDGDVLAYNDSKNNVWVCIFKEYANERVYDYCTLDKESFWERGNWNYLASFSYIPATKEQRDQLKKAMTDAGYTFDFEKKELKKIEHKSVWSEEDEVHLTNAIIAAEKEWGIKSCTSKWLKSIKDRVQPQWKPSEEQMEVLLSEVNGWTKGCPKQKVLEMLYNDLKKLKE